MQHIYKVFHGANNTGIRLFVEPLVGKEGDVGRIIFSLQSIEAGRETQLTSAYVELRKVEAWIKAFVMGTFKAFFPDGFEDWGRSRRWVSLAPGQPMTPITHRRRLLFRAEADGNYSLGIAAFTDVENAPNDETALEQVGNPLVIRLSREEALEMLVQIERFLSNPDAVIQTRQATENTVSQIPSTSQPQKPSRPSQPNPVSQQGLSERTAQPQAPAVQRMHASVTETLRPIAETAREQRHSSRYQATADRAPRRRREQAIEVFDPIDLARLFTTDGRIDLRERHQEEFHAVYLDSRRRLIKTARVPATPSVRRTRRGVSQELQLNALAIFVELMPAHAFHVGFVHNHPGEDVPEPSPEDLVSTRFLEKLCRKFQVNFYDHVIIGAHGFFSYMERECYGSFECEEDLEDYAYPMG